MMNREWNSGPTYYIKGSFHNKLGMLTLWGFIFLALYQIIKLIIYKI